MPATGRSPEMQFIPTRDALLGEGMTIRRALPSAQCRMIGAWCFLDHFGPVDATRGDGLRVGPHPHNSLQTFTWPLAGEILHRDSLGYEQIIRPGQVNLMTAGCGISHSEESPPVRSPRLHGAQLWIALPEAVRHCEPAFEHYPELPVIDRDGFRVTVLVGEALGELAPTRVFSPLLALDIACDGDAATSLAVPAEYELGALVLEGGGQRRRSAPASRPVALSGPRSRPVGCAQRRSGRAFSPARDRRRAVRRGDPDVVEFRRAKP